VTTDEELIQELSFPVYRRIATMIFVPPESHHASSVEMVAIDPRDLQEAQNPRARSELAHEKDRRMLIDDLHLDPQRSRAQR
jgi:hypothetical protein